MCGIWDWQSTIVKDLNDSQDPQNTLFCRENAFVAIYAFFQTTNVCFLPVEGGGGLPKADIVCFFTLFSRGLPLYSTFPLCQKQAGRRSYWCWWEVKCAVVVTGEQMSSNKPLPQPTNARWKHQEQRNFNF